jgi:hypothetical protein
VQLAQHGAHHIALGSDTGHCMRLERSRRLMAPDGVFQLVRISLAHDLDPRVIAQPRRQRIGDFGLRLQPRQFIGVSRIGGNDHPARSRSEHCQHGIMAGLGDFVHRQRKDVRRQTLAEPGTHRDQLQSETVVMHQHFRLLAARRQIGGHQSANARHKVRPLWHLVGRSPGRAYRST